ncbi:hypothetical protein V1477_018994 [Vespula maculifrons]|uniref:Uncharacterized protein n=1 Tax=Vespula maculifrons TaxID=7453 RepID=A0ABD2AT14_VESMC
MGFKYCNGIIVRDETSKRLLNLISKIQHYSTFIYHFVRYMTMQALKGSPKNIIIKCFAANTTYFYENLKK